MLLLVVVLRITRIGQGLVKWDRRQSGQRKEEMGRKHQGMGKRGVCQVPEGNEEQGKLENTGCKVTCGAPMTLVVKGLMMV